MRNDIGQLLWIGFEGTSASVALRRKLAEGQAGGVVLFKRNLEISTAADGSERCNLDALIELNAGLHRAAADGTPVWTAIDHEGGKVQRIKAPATVWPAMSGFARDAEPDEQLAFRVGEAMGAELSALGFDINFAPVLDVHSNPANPVIGDRAFGDEPERVAKLALALANGLAQEVLPCGKHFPGHGDTATDSHLELPRIDHDLARLEAVELLPFRLAAKAGLPMIMTAHVVFAALDAGKPATLSHEVITGLLRGKLNYRGLIVSDDLDMRAIVDHVGVEVAAVEAIRAGCDLLLLCKDEAHQQAATDALIRAAEGDSELRARIGESAQRVRDMKRGYFDVRNRSPRPARGVVGCDAHCKLASKLGGG